MCVLLLEIRGTFLSRIQLEREPREAVSHVFKLLQLVRETQMLWNLFEYCSVGWGKRGNDAPKRLTQKPLKSPKT